MSNRHVHSAVYRRDGWKCEMPTCLCPDGRAIDRKLRGTDSEWAPTVDHIVLRTLGGRDRMGNMRAAHRLCNQKDPAAARMGRIRVAEGIARRRDQGSSWS